MGKSKQHGTAYVQAEIKLDLTFVDADRHIEEVEGFDVNMNAGVVDELKITGATLVFKNHEIDITDKLKFNKLLDDIEIDTIY